MAIYWSPNSVPELKGLPRDEQKRLWKLCYRRASEHGIGKAALVLQVCSMPMACCLGWFVAWLFTGDSQMRSQVTGPAMLLATIAIYWSVHFLSEKARREIRIELGGWCLDCGYDIRATPERCPECGRAAGAESVSAPSRGCEQEM